MDRGPHRQPDLDRLRARLPHARRAGAAAGRQDPRPPHARCVSDQGAFFADAQPRKFKIGLFHIVTGSYDIPAAHVAGRRRVHEQGARRRRLPLLVPGHRGVVPRSSGWSRRAAYELGIDPAEFRVAELHPAGPVPVRSRRSASSTTRATTSKALDLALEKLGYDELREEQERGPRAGPAARHRPRHRSPRSSAPATAASTTSSGSRCSTPPSCASTRPARRSSSSASSRRARATRRRSRRSSPTSSGIPAEDIDVEEGDTDNTPYGLGHLRVAGRRRSPARRPRWSPASCATRRARSPRTCSRCPRRTSSGSGTASPSRAPPTAAKTIQEIAFAAYTNLPDGMEPGLEGVALLRPAEHDLPVRQLRRDRRGRPRHRRVEGADASSRSTTAACGSTR